MPTSLVSRDVVTEHLYDSFVSTLTSTVGLGMEKRGHAEVNSSQPVQSFPKAADESGVAVGDDVEREPVLAIPMSEEERCEVFRRDVCARGNEAEVAAEPVAAMNPDLKGHILCKQEPVGPDTEGTRKTSYVRNRA